MSDLGLPVIVAAYLVSVAAERQRPLAAPHGMQPVACADAADFANQWGLLR